MIEQSVSLASNGVVKVPGYEQLVRFGYTKNRGVYRLAVTASGEWEGLAIRCFWHVPDGKDPESSLVVDGYVAVPASVTAQPGSGCITFEGSDGAKVMTSADLRYRVSANSGTEDGTEPEPGTPAWQQLVDAVHADATAAEQAKTDAQTAAQQAGASAKKAGQALSDTTTAKEDALKAIGDKQTTATQADLQRGFDNQSVMSKLNGLESGLCDGFYAMNTGMLQGFNGVQQGLNGVTNAMQQGFNSTNVALMQGQNALATQLADCCCKTQTAIQGVNYNLATQECDTRNQMQQGFCATQNTMNNNTRDIIENQNSNTRAVLDFLTNDKIATLQSENNELRRAASQDRQSAFLTTAMNAQTNQIIGTLQQKAPVPAYQVPNPNAIYYGCGTGCGSCA